MYICTWRSKSFNWSRKKSIYLYMYIGVRILVSFVRLYCIRYITINHNHCFCNNAGLSDIYGRARVCGCRAHAVARITSHTGRQSCIDAVLHGNLCFSGVILKLRACTASQLHACRAYTASQLGEVISYNVAYGLV